MNEEVVHHITLSGAQVLLLFFCCAAIGLYTGWRLGK